LTRIVEQLQHKNQEAFAVHSELLSDLQALNEAYESGQADLLSEFNKLFDVLKKRKECLLDQISEDLLAKKVVIEVTELYG